MTYVVVPVSYTSCTCQVEAVQVLGAYEGVQVTELVMAEVQVGEEGAPDKA